MLVVQKYGGSSVADPQRLRQVAQRIADAIRAGHRVVVVVSAMGKTTDELMKLANAVSSSPPRRELDMLLTAGERISMALLAMAVHDLGTEAVSLTGSQSGIITDEEHNDARIIEVRPQRILENLEANRVVIVAGYQGVSRTREITTLGRGGSDTTAIALAAALKADLCEICSDVDGVYTADPRIVPDARRLSAISWDDLVLLARGGAKVIAASAAEMARDKNVRFLARATVGNGPGTRVGPDVSGISAVTARNDGTITVLGLGEDDIRGAVATLPLTGLRHEGRAVSFCTTPEHLIEAQRALHRKLAMISS